MGWGGKICGTVWLSRFGKGFCPSTSYSTSVCGLRRAADKATDGVTPPVWNGNRQDPPSRLGTRRRPDSPQRNLRQSLDADDLDF